MDVKYIIIYGKNVEENQVVSKAIENLANKKISIVTVTSLVDKSNYGGSTATKIIEKMESVFSGKTVILIDLDGYVVNTNNPNIKNVENGIKEITDNSEEIAPAWLEEYLNKRYLLQAKLVD